MWLQRGAGSLLTVMRICCALALLSAAACGGDSFRWYCDQLSTQASTWQPRSDCPGADPVLRLRPASQAGAPSCDGNSCLCTVPSWQYGHVDYAGGFFSHDVQEVCFGTATCSFGGGTATLNLVAHGPDLEVWSVTGADQLTCGEYTAEIP